MVKESGAFAVAMDIDGAGLPFLKNLMPPAGSKTCLLYTSKVFEEILNTAEQDFRDLLKIPDNYKVLFLSGGAHHQFAAVPMNLMKNGVADYIITGQWAKKAFAEAQKYGTANKIASSEDQTFSYIPDCSDLPVSENADYVYILSLIHICSASFKDAR